MLWDFMVGRINFHGWFDCCFLLRYPSYVLCVLLFSRPCFLALLRLMYDISRSIMPHLDIPRRIMDHAVCCLPTGSGILHTKSTTAYMFELLPLVRSQL
jgi:hypothetical protein